MSGVEDRMENYKSIWLHNVRSWCSSPIKSIFLLCHSYLDLSHDFHAQICFHSHFFSQRILLLAVENV